MLLGQNYLEELHYQKDFVVEAAKSTGRTLKNVNKELSAENLKKELYKTTNSCVQPVFP